MKNKIRLERPNAQFKESFINAVKEVLSFAESNQSTDWYKKLDVNFLEKSFDEYVSLVLGKAEGKNLQAGHVPCTLFWIIDDNNKYVGRISLRHHLNEQLRNFGGHIGYDIIPSRRKCGYASEALGLCLEQAKKLKITKALITCDEDNYASKKVIEKNGGVYQDKLKLEHETVHTLRYWITLDPR